MLGTMYRSERSAAARERGITTLLDAAQPRRHATIDVQSIGCDAIRLPRAQDVRPDRHRHPLARRELLESMPSQGGGDMIKTARSNSPPGTISRKFEAGTLNIAGAIGMGAAAKWIETTGRDAIADHERSFVIDAPNDCRRSNAFD